MYNPSDADEPVIRMHGRDQIARIPEVIKRYPKTYHVLGQSNYAVRDGVATGEVYCMAHHLTPDRHGDTNYVMYIRYADDYRPDRDAKWKIASRRVLVDSTETRAANPPGR